MQKILRVIEVVYEKFIFSLQIFFLVVVYGLFHGLVFLPVVLSVLGPRPYDSAVKCSFDDQKHSDQNVPLKTLSKTPSLVEVKNSLLLPKVSILF